MTAPSPRAPPSPEFSNLDCAFPPFPTSRAGTPRSGTPVQDPPAAEPPFGNDYVREHAEPYNLDSRGHSRGRSVTSARSRSGSIFSAKDIPRPSTANGNRRRPSLASLSGGPRPTHGQQPPVPSLPFQSSSMRGLDESPPRPNRPQGGYGGLGDPADLSNKPYNPYKFEPFNQEKANISKNRTQDSELFLPESSLDTKKAPSNRLPPQISNERSLPMRPPNGPLASPTRSQTFPRHNENRDSGISRRPSEPAPRQSRSPSRNRPLFDDRRFESSPSSETNPDFGFPPSRGRNDTRNYQPSNDFFPPRGSSRKREPGGLRPEVPPPIPDFAADLDIGNPYHTPSDSGSSHVSTVSAAQTASSRTTNSPPPPTSPYHKHYGTRDRNLLVSDIAAPLRLAPPGYGPPDSPTDPLMQQGRLSPIPRQYSKNPTYSRPAASMVSSSSTSSRPRRNGTISANKGPCRACALPITGKSISSADGRLSGRYHKECFACKTCSEPFRTADFYVLNDNPYCGQHYHALNGTLCASCGNGIEGPFLETTVVQSQGPEKFHPDCFTCTTCRVRLNEDYYELMGKPYCERDAFKATMGGHKRGPSLENAMSSGNGKPRGRPPGGGQFLAVGLGNGNPGRTMSGRNRFPERRTTKLMMLPGGPLPGGQI